MNTPNATVINLQIQGFGDSREVVNKLNEFYGNTGVIVSQRAKYERPSWFYIAAILNGSDMKRAHSPQDIQGTLEEHGIYLTIPAISRTLKIMKRLDESIHPHRRNCGISCYDVVRGLGHIRITIASNCSGRGRPPYIYYFGNSHDKVQRFRKAFNITLNP